MFRHLKYEKWGENINARQLFKFYQIISLMTLHSRVLFFNLIMQMRDKKRDGDLWIFENIISKNFNGISFFFVTNCLPKMGSNRYNRKWDFDIGSKEGFLVIFDKHFIKKPSVMKSGERKLKQVIWFKCEVSVWY